MPVGVIVGVLVSVPVGVIVGVSVGVPAGVLVGVIVGVAVSVWVGVPVGVVVGVLVGLGSLTGQGYREWRHRRLVCCRQAAGGDEAVDKWRANHRRRPILPDG